MFNTGYQQLSFTYGLQIMVFITAGKQGKIFFQ